IQREFTAFNLPNAERVLNECNPERRNWEWHFFRRQIQPLLARLDVGGHVGTVAFQPNGHLLAVATDKEVSLWQAPTGRQVRTFPGRLVAAFSPDGRRLAAAGPGDTVKVWDIASGKELVSIPGHTVTSRNYSEDLLQFDADGRRLVSSSRADKRVKVWD